MGFPLHSTLKKIDDKESIMLLIIDRFEGHFAVCEDDDKNMHNIERSKLPLNAKEGDVLIVEGSNYVIDRRETEKRKLRIKKMMDSLWD
jgi:hypothetical protein